jgi:hypothetical protein
MEERLMALALTIAAMALSLPVSLAAWLLGLVTFGQAVVAYVVIGWCFMAGAALFGWSSQRLSARPAARTPGKAIVVEVTVASQN